MAGRAFWKYLYQQCVGVAVIVDSYDLLVVAGGLAFCPQLFAAAAPESGLAGFQSLVQSFFIHVSHHEYLTSVIVLKDCRDQTMVVKFQFDSIVHFVSPRFYFLTAMPSPAR